MPTPYPLLQQRLQAPDGKGRHRTRRSPSPCQIRSRTRPLWCSPRSPAPTRPPATAALLLLLWVDTGLVPEAAARGYGPKLSPDAVARVGQEARLAPAGLAHKLRLLERGVGQLGAERIHNCRSKEYVAASLREQGVPFVVLEREDCIASLWQKRTYDRLKIHLPKQFCQLPRMPFPADYPKYPTRRQFIQYLETYAATFDIKHEFGSTVQSARYDETSGLWRVHSSSAGAGEMEYIGRWLVVATGENAERVIPDILDLDGFAGEVAHVSNYKSGEKYRGKSVLVVGCGNSGMEVSLDLCDHGALPSMVVRDAVHMLPREVCGRSTFELWFVDKLMVFFAWIILGNLTSFGIRRPTIGPLTLKNTHGRTPVLDTGAIQD